MTRSSFPALVIATLTLAVCIFSCHLWLTHWLPGISGRATVDPSLTILDIPVQIPFPVDLILVTGLFFILYSIIILIAASRANLIVGSQLRQRLGAVLISIAIIVAALALGNLLSWLLRSYLPPEVRNSLFSMAVNVDFHFPYSGYATIPYRGDAFSFLSFVVALIISIRIMSKVPQSRPKFRLTREQRLTPYQRMLADRRNGTIPSADGYSVATSSPHQPIAGSETRQPIARSDTHEPVALPESRLPVAAVPTLPADNSIPTLEIPHTHHRYLPSHGLCRNDSLGALQPEAVNFRPLG